MDDIPRNPFSRNRPTAEETRRSTALCIPQLDQIRTAQPSDIKFVDKLQKKYANCVGFLPKVAIETLLAQGHIRLALDNDDAAGYLLSRTRLGWQPLMRSITQTAVAMDARRRHHGLALLRSLEIESVAQGTLAIQACCAVGLDSNEFWEAAGFVPICHMTPANVRGREIICWRKALTRKMPVWFAMPPRLAGHRAKRPSLNRNPNRSTDAITAARNFIV